ncbi:MAG TPA: isocitrate lyase/phosphoenolpyruvate mutase family protein [Candidatus Krumholzibacteria bacterium]|nr:isocitrate lyase/phosphoenolpyruvate mutase family protein [Candidatus Krumholzibacteria bacterium]
MASRVQNEKAAALLALHGGGRLLILPNVWDPLGARILQAKGYPAVATASAAISASLGFQDGERIKRTTLMEAVARIARSVDVPVSADIEAGYARTPSELEDTIRAVIGAGIVGINIEDGLGDGGALRAVDEQCARIAAVREVAAREGLHLVINARIDSFYVSSAFSNSADATEDAVARAAAYAKAGADCVYPLGPGDEKTVRTLRARIVPPINILGSPNAAPLSVLESIGVNRVSFGPYVQRALLRKFADIADGLLNEKDVSGLKGMLTRNEVHEYLLDGPE